MRSLFFFLFFSLLMLWPFLFLIFCHFLPLYSPPTEPNLSHSCKHILTHALMHGLHVKPRNLWETFPVQHLTCRNGPLNTNVLTKPPFPSILWLWHLVQCVPLGIVKNIYVHCFGLYILFLFNTEFYSYESNVHKDVNFNSQDHLYLIAGVDVLLAQHLAHLFIRDPISVFSEKIDQNDEEDTDHFEVNLCTDNVLSSLP